MVSLLFLISPGHISRSLLREINNTDVLVWLKQLPIFLLLLQKQKNRPTGTLRGPAAIIIIRFSHLFHPHPHSTALKSRLIRLHNHAIIIFNLLKALHITPAIPHCQRNMNKTIMKDDPLEF
jgi:hypothetical protein